MIKNKEPYNPKINDAIKNIIEERKMHSARTILEKRRFIIIDNQGVMASWMELHLISLVHAIGRRALIITKANTRLLIKAD